MRIEGAGVADPILTPYLVEQFLSWQRLADVLHQHTKQVILPVGQMQELPGSPDFPCCAVKRYLTDHKAI